MMKEDLRKCCKWGANRNDEATEEEDPKEQEEQNREEVGEI